MKINTKLLAALESRGLSEPTLAQSSTWPVIDSGSNVLLIAPTGVENRGCHGSSIPQTFRERTSAY